jgi:copper chaperone
MIIMTTIKIKGMSCQHCVKSTTEALEKLPGISNVTVNLDSGEATYDGNVDKNTAEEAIKKLGFEVV